MSQHYENFLVARALTLRTLGSEIVSLRAQTQPIRYAEVFTASHCQIPRNAEPGGPVQTLCDAPTGRQLMSVVVILMYSHPVLAERVNGKLQRLRRP